MDRSNLIDLALFILRLAVGVVFIAHGLQKVFGMFGGSGIDGLSRMLESLGVMPPVLWAWVAAIGELAGGTLLVLGIFPRLSALVIGMIMMAAIVLVHWKNGYFASNGGFEYPLLNLMCSIAIILAGGGKYSIFNKL
ncbi:MAG: DoxX family membrane protein [Candidatus Omnitrophica bacterium]|nr:DoxX family membrane protein [Candidatus Omnitrophota bacterium]